MRYQNNIKHKKTSNIKKYLSRKYKVFVGKNLFSIRKFLIATLLSILTVTIFITALLNYWQISKQNQAILEMQLVTSSKILDSIIIIEMHNKANEQLDDILNKSAQDTINDFLNSKHYEPQNLYIKYHDQMIFQVWDLRSNKLLIKSSAAPNQAIKGLDGGVHSGFKNIYINNQQWMAYSLVNHKEKIKVVFAINSVSHQHSNLELFFRDLTILLIVYLFLGAAIIMIVNKSIEPLMKVKREISLRNAMNLAQISSKNTPVEIKPLIREINSLFRRVNKSIEREKGFTADAAHELKTPLAALKTQVQVAIREKDQRQKNKILNNVIVGTNRCVHVIEQLLTLSHIEPKAILADGNKFSLVNITQDLISEIAYIALDKNIDLSFSAGEMDVKNHNYIDPCLIFGNDIMIGILLRNVIDNAIRYTPENGVVKVEMTRQTNDNNKSFIILDVSDSGPGIPKELRARIFDRFYRKLGSKESGSGLGLSIVKQIIRLHKASIKVMDSDLSSDNKGANYKDTKMGTKIRIIFAASS